MAGKKIWVSWLPGKACEAELQQTIKALQQVGLEVSGAPWIDDLEKCAWTELAEMLAADNGPDLWLVSGRQEDFANPRFTYGLSLLVAAMSPANPTVKVFAQCIDGKLEQALPTLCADWGLLDSNPGWSAKVVAAAYSPAAKKPEADFYFTVIAHSALGQWFEVGPVAGEDEWQGAMFGLNEGDAKIVFQAVGPRGQLPEKAVNEFPAQGIEAEISGVNYTAWALQNKISDQQSYYVKVTGFPQKIMFGGHPGTDQAEVQVISLS
jgi:hypothetical protein